MAHAHRELRRGEALERDLAPADLAPDPEQPAHAIPRPSVQHRRRARPARPAARDVARRRALAERLLHGLLEPHQRFGPDQQIARAAEREPSMTVGREPGESRHRTTFAHIGDSQPSRRNARISRRLKSPSPRFSSARPRPESSRSSSARNTSRSPEIAGVSTPAARPADSKRARPRPTSSVTYRCSNVRISLQRPLAMSFALAPAP